MRVLMTTSTFPRWKNDTQAPFVFHLAKHLVGLGHEVIIIAPHADKAERREVVDNILIYRFKYFMPSSLQKLCYGSGILPNFKSSFLAKLQLLPFCMSHLFASFFLVWKYRPDLIHSHWIIPQGILALPIRLIHKGPILTTAHGSDVFAFSKGYSKYILKLGSKSADLITVNSRATHKVAARVIPKEKMVIVPMGVEDSSFVYTEKTVSKVKEPVILTVGRLIKLKGTHYAIEAMATIRKRYPRSKLLIIGEGPEEQNLKSLTSRLGLDDNVSFLGKIPAESMPKYFQNSDVFLFPSVELKDGSTEGFGVVLLEAMASGTPVITTNAGGIIDIITTEENGLIVGQANAQELADATLRVLSDTELSRKIRKQGIETVKKRFTWDTIAGHFDRLYEQLVKNTSDTTK